MEHNFLMQCADQRAAHAPVSGWVLTFTVSTEISVTAQLEAMASDPFGIDLSLELLSKLPEPKRLTVIHRVINKGQ